MDYKDFFNNTKPALQEPQEQVVTEFHPNPKKGQNGVFNAIVKFLPNPGDPQNKSVITKYVAYLKDPDNPMSSRTIDCPSTVGAQDPIQNTFFALRASANLVLQENAKMFSRKQKFASLIQVLKCDSAPQLVNRILVWNYGIKIYEKIHNEMYPPMGEGSNPFDPINGRPFSVSVKEVSNYPNYDACNFFNLDPNQGGMRIIQNDAQGIPQIYVVTKDVIATEQGQATVFNYLKDNAPDTTKYEYHEWDTETFNFVNKCIQVYSNPQTSLQIMSAAQNPGGQIQQQPMAQQASAMPQMNMPQMPNAPIPSAPQMPQMPQMGLPQMPSAPQMPQMGLGTPSVAPTTAPGGFETPQLSPDVNNLINNTAAQAPTTQTGAPAVGLNLDDILNGQIIGQ